MTKNVKTTDAMQATPVADLFPEAGRTITATDNQPPEPLPQQLANVAELPTMMKADLEQLTTDALAQLDVYARVPAEIADKEVYERVTTLGTLIKGVIDKIEKRRKEVKDPYLKATTAIDGAFKLILPVQDAADRILAKELENAHAGTKRLLSAYDTKLYIIEQARITAEQEKVAAAAAADGITLAPVAAEDKVEVVRSAHGGSAVRNIVTEWTVVEEAKLPRSVLSVDPAKVQALLDSGATEIPGIALSKKVETHVKRR